MYEYVLGIAGFTDQETVALQPVEPFDADRLEGARLVEQRGRVDPVSRGGRPGELGHHCTAEIDGQDLACLKSPLLLRDQAFDHRAFRKTAPVMFLQDTEMNKNVAFDLFADEEPEAACCVEPFDHADDLDQSIGVDARRIGSAGKRITVPNLF